MKIISI